MFFIIFIRSLYKTIQLALENITCTLCHHSRAPPDIAHQTIHLFPSSDITYIDPIIRRDKSRSTQYMSWNNGKCSSSRGCRSNKLPSIHTYHRYFSKILFLYRKFNFDEITKIEAFFMISRSEERRVGKVCRD